MGTAVDRPRPRLALCASTGVDVVLAQANGSTRIPLIVAHRGGQEKSPAGSLDSFLSASTDGYPVEMDLRTLDDGHIAISHDSTTGETTEDSSDVSVSSLTVDEWTSMCLHYDSEQCFRAVTFGQVLDALPNDALLVVENKQDEVSLKRLERILDARSLRSSTLIESLDFNKITQASADGFHTMYVMHKNQDVDVDAIADAGVDVLAVSSYYPLSLLRKCRARGLRLWVWTVDRTWMAVRWSRAGVDGIITDYPRTMTRLLSAQAAADDSADVPRLRMSAAELQSRIRERSPRDDAREDL
ncbi:glycerophosphodiester phosphodiesterase [uncultured Bifidobacterium sp.]|uniref:glycerophosphodiester phosphodiesterase n=1 Tax=uncultured Bifidobacterium sp. TaxID=165187 RepID=UPI0026156D6B|nr:glycerophosphodiester phosphodiesterase [uncultured Bifidobacterium sp.]